MAYRGRLAPSPTGYLHLGHARTFWVARERAEAAGGTLILRQEDLDHSRCRPAFAVAALEDLRWLGLRWSEGPDLGGPFAPYTQSERFGCYVATFDQLRASGALYPCTCSRREIAQSVSAPHATDEEPLYPGTCRPLLGRLTERPRAGVNWRFRVPDGLAMTYEDRHLGPQRQTCGVDFGDFLVWRKDDVPAYQLAVVTDDAAMQITEVVRGADLVVSTFRQLLLYQALHLPVPGFFHTDLLCDDHGQRLAKRHEALSLRSLRARGLSPAAVRALWSR